MAQANALIPWLESVFTETRKAVEELHLLRMSTARARAEAGVAIEPKGNDRMRELEAQIRRRLEEATSLGIEVRRVDGLVDFPGWIEGQLVYLCWKYGESEVTHYHPTSEGFLGRRPLPKQSPRELN